MRDLISRQAAIDAIYAGIYDFFDGCGSIEAPMNPYELLLLKINKAITARINAMPVPADGKWSEAERPKSEIFYCSSCGGAAYQPWIGRRSDDRKNVCKYKFCPNCGAKMKV